MKVENKVALHYILQDELYLLGTDKPLYEINAMTGTATEETPTDGIAQTIDPVVIKLEQEEKEQEEIIQAVTFNYLGQNLKNFLILVHYLEQEFIADAHLAALQNILKRKDMELNDVAIVNMATYSPAKLDELTDFFKPAKLLILGKSAQPQDINPLVLNTPKQLDGITILYSFDFNEMMDNVENKKAFWEQMKAL